MNKALITVTGPTCSGKSTLTNMLVGTGKFTEIVSTTTRLPRTGEVDGKNYHFVSKEEFDKIEMMERITFNGKTYGASVAEFEEKFSSGLVPVIVVDPNGMFQINRNAKEKGWRVINVWVNCPPNVQSRRFLQRFSEDITQYQSVMTSEDFDDYVKLMEEYSNRMASIMTTETAWINQFMDGKTGDAVFLDVFDRQNQKEVIDTIVAMV